MAIDEDDLDLDDEYPGPHNETQSIVDYMERSDYENDPSDYTDLFETDLYDSYGGDE